MDSYLQGESSIAEEQFLRQYFASPEETIPDEFRYAKALFGYFDAAVAENTPPARRKSRLNPLLRIARIALPVAAAVVLVWMLLPIHHDAERRAYCYVNGQPVYDRDFAESQAELAISTLSSTLQLQNQAMSNMMETLINH